MLDLLPKERKFLFGSIITGILFTLFRLLKSFTLFTLIPLIPLVAIILFYSCLIYCFEHPVNPKNFRTPWDALYFTLVTMATVGFGDVTPISQSGRFITVLMILTRIGLMHWQVPDLIKRVVKRVVKTANPVERVCLGCGLAFHDGNAGFCKMCGAKLPT